MKSKYDIAIAGGGIVGLISAILLRKSRAFSESDIYIVEKNEKKRFLAINNFDLLHNINNFMYTILQCCSIISDTFIYIFSAEA